MYAIFQSGGKQYRVSPGDVVDLELVGAEPGSRIELDDVRLVAADDRPLIGRPKVEGAAVVGEVLGDVKGPKITVFTFRRRKSSRRKLGHRQKHTRVRIVEIKTPA